MSHTTRSRMTTSRPVHSIGVPNSHIEFTFIAFRVAGSLNNTSLIFNFPGPLPLPCNEILAVQQDNTIGLKGVNACLLQLERLLIA